MTSSDTVIMEPKAYPMNGGDGAYSYTQNSQFQREASTFAMKMIEEAINDKLEITSLISRSSNTTTIHIADLGCSVGPNSLITMQNVIQVMANKYMQLYQYSSSSSSQGGLPSSTNRSTTTTTTLIMPEFQVWFNDHASNDFNTLFTSLPPDRNYFVAGVPGSFHGRLFPESSLHFVHSSYALQWLSRLPQELMDKSSSAWNKGRIHYTSASKEVAIAYADQFTKDMDIFLKARSQEIVVGGMMILIMTAVPDEVHYSQLPAGVLFNSLEHSLMDMIKVGLVTEAEVDSFNLPLYTTSPKEMTKLVERNGCFSIEKMEITNPRSNIDGPLNVPAIIMHLRAGFEGIFTKHFGRKIIDDLFERTLSRSAEIASRLESSYKKGTQLFVVLKRK